MFRMICGSGGSKRRLAKAVGAEPCGRVKDEKLHAVVAQNTFPSQNVQNTPTSDHFWKLWCRKTACHCGAKRMFDSKYKKHIMFGPLLDVEMSSVSNHFWKLKKWTPLWHEIHLEGKVCKTPGSDQLWKLRCWKSARGCGAKRVSK